MNKRWITLSAIASVVIGAWLLYSIAFDKQHRNIAEEDAAFVLVSSDLHRPFKEVDSLMTKTFVNQAIEVSGNTSHSTSTTLELDYKIQITLKDSLKNRIPDGTAVTVKGRCVGYDDLLEVVKIDQATIIDKK